MIQTKRNFNNSTIESVQNKTTNQNWLPKVGGGNLAAKIKHGALSPQPVSMSNQTLTNKFMN